ncbi:MAG: hypothetical protein GY724_29900, partial [Actinomycetia bacterium]|nr:hypothetical protein [Actinomycetes bacterium]
EVNLLDYFTEDSPYLEETIRPGEAVMIEAAAHLEGLVATLAKVEVMLEPRNGTLTLTVGMHGHAAMAVDGEGSEVSQIRAVGPVTFNLTVVDGGGFWLVHDRGHERVS